jgi:energy-converting hydrogenase A subunit E
MEPELILGLAILIIGAVASTFPRPKTYLSRIITLEVPGWGLLLIMLAYDEALALLTFIAVTAISTFVMVRVVERRGEP